MTTGPTPEQPPVNMARPALSIREAVKATGTSRSTIRRYREAGKFPSAYQYGDDHAWHIPVDDLLRAGLRLTEQGSGEQGEQEANPPSEQGGGPGSEQGEQAPVSSPEPTVPMPLSQVIELNERVARAEAAAEAAALRVDDLARSAATQTQALERAITGLEHALRAIEAGPSTSVSAPTSAANIVDVRQPAPPAETVPVARHWWGGKRK